VFAGAAAEENPNAQFAGHRCRQSKRRRCRGSHAAGGGGISTATAGSPRRFCLPVGAADGPGRADGFDTLRAERCLLMRPGSG
jgi:hypothetical protein